MSPEIRELDAATRDRIAAGEVVERPASVVKELVENALDADASRIDVAVAGGGTERVVVSDDGVGMSEADARTAVREHTTSKLRDLEDLEAIGTLGFRGEALHAIGSVARLTLRTKPRGGSRGTELVVEGGDVVDCSPAGCPEGTTAEVTDLFANVPARRKYLKTEATEFDRVQRVVAGYALANPDVAVTLERDGRETFATPGDSDRRIAVLAIYGREVAASMIPVGATRGESAGGGDQDSPPDGPLAGVEGLVSHPETNRAGREYVTTLVNGRYVTSAAAREAIVEAYGSQLASDRFPFAIVDLDVPPGGVDVNVHPRKLEVLFADEAGVRDQVTDAVEAALLDEGLLRTRAPRGRSAPAQTDVAGDRSEGTDAPGTATDRGSRRSARSTGGDSDDSSAGTATPGDPSGPPTASDASTVDATSDAGTADAEPGSGAAAAASESGASDASGPAGEAAPTGAGAHDGTTGDRFHETPDQRTLDGRETAGTPASLERLPSMSVLGQFDDTYLVAASDDGILLVDQHAADERVHYERLGEAFADDVTTQALAEPVALEVTAREAELLEEHDDALARLGFRVRRAGDRTVEVTTVPAPVADRVGGSAPELVRDLLGEFAAGDPAGTVEAVVDDLLGDLACHPAVTGNTSLREGAVADLLSALDDCENPWACPHGRPTIIELSREEIEGRFERDYPGHGGRRE